MVDENENRDENGSGKKALVSLIQCMQYLYLHIRMTCIAFCALCLALALALLFSSLWSFFVPRQ
jgi:hypothetical protein